MKLSNCSDKLAAHICTLTVKEGIEFLERNGCQPDNDGVWNWGDYDFFQCYPDSTTLYFEA